MILSLNTGIRSR